MLETPKLQLLPIGLQKLAIGSGLFSPDVKLKFKLRFEGFVTVTCKYTSPTVNTHGLQLAISCILHEMEVFLHWWGSFIREPPTSNSSRIPHCASLDLHHCYRDSDEGVQYWPPMFLPQADLTSVGSKITRILAFPHTTPIC